MISDIDKYVKFLVEHKLTEHQFLMLWLIKTKNTDAIALYRRNKSFNIAELDDLIERKWIDDFGLVKDNVRTFNIVDFVVTDKFDKIIIDPDDAYEELCKVYPKWFNFKGIKAPAITGDPDKLAKLYFECHKGNRLIHERIVHITREYHRNKDPMEKMENYIKNKRWEMLEDEIKDSGGANDAFKTI